MGRLFAHYDPSNYAFETRSLRIAGHSTSVRLETLFWTMLEEMAASEGMSLGKFLTNSATRCWNCMAALTTSHHCCAAVASSISDPGGDRSCRALPSRSARSLPPHSTERHHRHICNGGGVK
jgi:predicted DNA-binding ribbon-helix-helix protein